MSVAIRPGSIEALVRVNQQIAEFIAAYGKEVFVDRSLAAALVIIFAPSARLLFM